MGIGEKSVFPRISALIVWRSEAMGQKIDRYQFAEFDVFPPKNHDSIVFMQFC